MKTAYLARITKLEGRIQPKEPPQQYVPDLSMLTEEERNTIREHWRASLQGNVPDELAAKMAEIKVKVRFVER